MHRVRNCLTASALALVACGPGGVGESDDEIGGESTSSEAESESESESDTQGESAGETSTDTGDPACVEVHDSLTVTADTPLESLACVREVGFLAIENTALTDLSVFPALESVDSFWIRNNPELTSLAGADSLEYVMQLLLWELPELTSLEGFAPDTLALLHLGPGLDILGSLNLAENVAVYQLVFTGWDRPDVSPVADLQPTLGDDGHFTVQLTDTAALTDLSAIAACCGGPSLDLFVYQPGLIDFHGLESQTAMGRLELRGSSIESFAGLENLEQLDDLLIHPNCPDHDNVLTSLAGLDSLATVGRLEIADNPELLTLAGLDSLAVVDELVVVDNDALTDLALPEGLAVDTKALVYDNDALPQAQIDGFFANIDAVQEEACGNGEPEDCLDDFPCPP
jgi:hypothetical protein